MPFGNSYETALQTAQRLGVTVRAIQKQAAAGQIPGAMRHGRAWMIPREYLPADGPGAAETNDSQELYLGIPFRVPLPLLSSAYPVGEAEKYISALQDEDDRRIARAEYLLFTGHMEKAAMAVEPYMDSNDQALRFSANMISLCANLSSGHSHMTKFALHNLQTQVHDVLAANAPVRFQAVALFATAAIAVMLHMPPPEGPLLEEYIAHLPGGLKLYACYILAYRAYLDKDYSKCLAIADISLAVCPTLFPAAAVFTHLAAAMALAGMKRTQEARVHMEKAWKIAQPDGLLQPFSEHHGMLHGMVEIYFRKAAPDILPRILEITQKFNTGWRSAHNALTQHDVADNLTTTEFTIAMLYHREWTVKEIADHMEISVRTVNRIITSVYNKLGISNRSSLERFMLK